MTKFVKGHPGNEKGRGKGTPNVSTRTARVILNNVLFGELDKIKESLAEVRTKDHARYLEIVAKLLVYVIPRKTDLTSDDNPVQPITGIQIIIDDTTT